MGTYYVSTFENNGYGSAQKYSSKDYHVLQMSLFNEFCFVFMTGPKKLRYIIIPTSAHDHYYLSPVCESEESIQGRVGHGTLAYFKPAARVVMHVVDTHLVLYTKSSLNIMFQK